MAEFDLLDQLSTSHTNLRDILANADISPRTRRETEAHIEEAEIQQSARCENGAPFICFIDASDKARLVQGCCNNWTCKRCGVIRAKHEYGRMVNGAKVLSDKRVKLYFLTLTCRGRDMSLDEAEAGYKDWCDRFLTACRNKCNRGGGEWFYGGVTERQQRGHPHSHLTISWCPPDAWPYRKGDTLPNGVKAKHDGLYSQWLVNAAVRAGLGPMVDLSAVQSAVGVAVYQSKYMFKDAVRTVWPPGWKRVRYSQSWPKLPEQKCKVAFPVIKSMDWLQVQALERTVWADSAFTAETAKNHGIFSVKHKKP